MKPTKKHRSASNVRFRKRNEKYYAKLKGCKIVAYKRDHGGYYCLIEGGILTCDEGFNANSLPTLKAVRKFIASKIGDERANKGWATRRAKVIEGEKSERYKLYTPPEPSPTITPKQLIEEYQKEGGIGESLMKAEKSEQLPWYRRLVKYIAGLF